MSSANRERRKQNREARMVAVEERLRRTKRQRFIVAGIGLVLAVGVAVVLVARAGSGGKSAASTTTSTTAANTSSTASTSSTTTTIPVSVAGKPCVAETKPFPPGAPFVPVRVGSPPTKLFTHDYKIGTGALVTPSSTVTVDYVGVACSSGKSFTSTYSPPSPSTAPISGFIQGWQQGIPGMHVGGERLLGIPPALAYGAQSPPGSGIAPNETLWFVVQVLKSTTPAPTTTASTATTSAPTAATTTVTTAAK